MKSILTTVLIVWACGAAAQETSAPPKMLNVLGYGVNCAFDVDFISTDEDTIDGEVIHSTQDEPGFDVVTTRVPARVGLSFGVEFELLEQGAPEGLIAVVRHPPMGSEGREVQAWRMPSDKGYAGGMLYGLEDQIELVLGSWQFELYDVDRLLLVLAFELVEDDRAPEVMSHCYGLDVGS